METAQKPHEKANTVREGSTKPSVTVLLPAFNEASIITECLTILANKLSLLDQKYDWDILIVNDGSSDDTGSLAEEFAKSRTNVSVYHNIVNQNLGGALRRGFKEAEGQYIVVLDIDLSFGPEHVEKLMDAAIKEDADVVIASPYMKGGKTTKVPFHRLLLSKGLNKLMRHTSGINLHSFTGMARAYRREFLDTLNLKTNNYSINPEIIHKTEILRGRIIEIPAHLDWTYQVEYGQNRTSSVRIFKGIMNGLMSSFIFRPYGLFMMVGLILLFLSLYMIAWIFYHVYAIYPEVQVANEFFDDRFTEAVSQVYNKRPHAFLIGGFTFVTAIQFLGLGFISLQKKRYFDELFHLNSAILKRTKDS
ncbi:glycosyltransferase family 2 protein [uncultured Eudoraea sp.]|uniref:glycosyltransferase family 2 protein n=1 Tax=uncultured Eudoraea sp. TaxID=1035614 RepID=UPI002635E8C3|nr:glycosyltransferase family 2 protein [uncultured Eudoraea sp.]